MQRVKYYDAAKVLAIFLVCFYHGNVLNKDILAYPSAVTYFHYFIQCALSICVPLFFVVNGALLLNGVFSLRRNIEKTVKIFFLIYAWGLILLILLMYICNDVYTIKSFVSSLWQLKLQRINHLWFLRALLGIYILLPLIKPAFDHEDKNTIHFIMVCLFFFSFGNNVLSSALNVFGRALDGKFNFFPMINPFGGYFFAIFYFMAGGVLAKMIKTGQIRFGYKLLVAAFLLSQTILFLYGISMTRQTGKYYDVVWNGYDTVMTLLMTVSAFMLLAKYDYQNVYITRVITFIGKNTFGVYILHIIFLKAFSPLFKTSIVANSLLANVAYVSVIVALSLGTNELLSRNRVTSKLIRI